MAIAIDSNKIVYVKKSSSHSSNASSNTSSNTSSSTTSSSLSPLPLTVSSYSSTTSPSASSKETRSIPEMLFNLPSVLVKNMIQGAMYLVNNFINYLPYSIINHHQEITINFWFQFRSLLCPFRPRFTMKKMNVSTTSSLPPCSLCSNGQTNNINLPDVIPINDSTRRSNVQLKCSSTLIIDVGSTLRDVSNKFNSNHLRFR